MDDNELFESINFSDQEIEEIEPKKKSTEKPTQYTKTMAYKIMLAFGIVFMSFIFTFNVWLTPIKVVGSSMQPTINVSITSESDDVHCDIVYYNQKKNYTNDDIVIVKNNNYKYIPYLEKTDEFGNLVAKQDVAYFIKRIIACPGQTITFFYTNQEPALLPKVYYYDIIVKDADGKVVDLDDSYLDEDMKFTATEIIERSNRYPIFAEIFEKISDWQNLDDSERMHSITVPENTYYVMGDNRNNSEDSRYFGVVSHEDIEGNVRLQIPFGQNIIQAIWIKIKSFI